MRWTRWVNMIEGANKNFELQHRLNKFVSLSGEFYCRFRATRYPLCRELYSNYNVQINTRILHLLFNKGKPKFSSTWFCSTLGFRRLLFRPRPSPRCYCYFCVSVTVSASCGHGGDRTRSSQLAARSSQLAVAE